MKPRYEGPPVVPNEVFKHLHQSRRGAMRWDDEMADFVRGQHNRYHSSSSNWPHPTPVPARVPDRCVPKHPSLHYPGEKGLQQAQHLVEDVDLQGKASFQDRHDQHTKESTDKRVEPAIGRMAATAKQPPRKRLRSSPFRSQPDLAERDPKVEIFGEQSQFVALGNQIPPKYLNYNIDWTWDRNMAVWDEKYDKRFCMMREMLLHGRTVQMSSGGDSLVPLVYPDEVCVFAPASGKRIRNNDIVFCRVQPGNHWYCHLVWRVEKDFRSGFQKDKFIIGNNKIGQKRKENGYCFREHIYGILERTARGVYLPPRHDTSALRHRST
jgi:hypothetical protein